MNFPKNVFITLFLLTVLTQHSLASDVLTASDWKFSFKGFVETDLTHDTTRSFREIAGNAPVARPGTFEGDNGRMQMSQRNTRLVLSITPPEEDDLKQNILLASDFLGYNPNPSAGVNTEAAFYTNPTPRLLLAFYTIEKNNWKILAGLGGSLFGWAPNYFLTTVSVSPVSGSVYFRNPQLTAIKTISFEGSNILQAGFSLARPAQRDSEMPNIDAGMRFAFGDRKAGFSTATGDAKIEVANVALSATYRQFVVPSTSTTATKDNARKNGGAIAFDMMIPLIASEDQTVGNTLILTAEYSRGSGYSESFIGFSGNISQLPSGTAGSLSSVTSLDPGQGGFNSNGDFTLTSLQSWNTQLQYHLPSEYRSFVTLGYGQLFVVNSDRFTALGSAVIYDKSETYFINFFHDVTKRVRIAVEYDMFSTHYVDDVTSTSNRFQFSTWFRF